MALTNRVRTVAWTIVLGASTAATVASQFPDAHESPPSGWSGPVFVLSQSYPSTLPTDTSGQTWRTIDFRTSPDAYLRAVLAYVYDGNLDVDWVLQNNAKRHWYHAPWMHWGPSGREFVHGLTKERSSRPKELAPTQTTALQNWAVGFYNDLGGYVLGRVWADPTKPDVSKAVFPEGTVSAKLLFTEGDVTQVPFLKDSPEWDANIWTSPANQNRTVRKVRILQLDVAVRDSRADSTTGWVFGTFIYQNTAPGDPWQRMVPVGVMWGNDPGVTPEMVAAGTKLLETWLNPAVSLSHYGWAGRLNGPVDNPTSSCLSCHSTAQDPTSSPMTFGTEADNSKRLCWFRNVRAAEPFDVGSTSADYSLQISSGVLNLHESRVTPGPTFTPAPSPTPKPPCATATGGPSTTSTPGPAVALAIPAAPAAVQPSDYVVINGKRYYRVSRD